MKSNTLPTLAQIRWLAGQRVLAFRSLARFCRNRAALAVETRFNVSPYYRVSRCGLRCVLGRLSLDAALWLSAHGCPTFGYAVALPARVWR